MVFDKSKVCVAGLHKIPEGTKGWGADSVNILEGLIGTKKYLDTYISTDGNLFYTKKNYYKFFYPELEKKYRPYKTIEEAEKLLGKKIKSKDGRLLTTVTILEYNMNNDLVINGLDRNFLLYDCIMASNGEPVGVEE